MIHGIWVVALFSQDLGSEIVQGLLPVRPLGPIPRQPTGNPLTQLQNGRDFDPYDILANVVGSLIALFACSWYHKRMLERRRAARNYHIVPGEEQDVELGDASVSNTQQETGVLHSAETTNVTQELDNWDENAEDWEEDEPRTESAATEAPSTAPEVGDSKKRSD